MTAQTIKYLLSCARQKLADSPSAGIDSEVLLAHVLDTGRSFLYANSELELPRPETEILVETALQKIPSGADWRLADLGTGSGAIALALASERRRCDIHATEISKAALSVAQANASRLKMDNIHFYGGSWTEPLAGFFNLIASNPPYVDADDPHLQKGDLRYEPREALTPGQNGLDAISEIAQCSKPILTPGGWLLLEHGWRQGPACRQILQDGGFVNVTTSRDLQGHERVTVGQKT